jgi:thioredoxin reductase
MPDEEVPVLIVGGSLVGLTTAMLLGHHGVPSLSVEQRVRAKSFETYGETGGIIAVESLAGRELATYVKELNEGVEGFSPPGRDDITRALATALARTA